MRMTSAATRNEVTRACTAQHGESHQPQQWAKAQTALSS